MRPSFRAALIQLSLTVVAGCGAQNRVVFVAPTAETIVSTTEERTADPPSHLIYVENHSTVPVTVFSVVLAGCENIKPRCDARPTKVHVQPGQRALAIRIEPTNPQRAFGYRFGFSWHADSSSTAAIASLAGAGDVNAKAAVAAGRRADSLRRTEVGLHYNELTRDDFRAIAARAVSMRADPESLLMAPGERVPIARIRLLMSDAHGQVLGQTRWVQWMVPIQNAVQLIPPEELAARQAGRTTVHFRLADEARRLLASPIDDVEFPVIVAYPLDPHAPGFVGRALDADSKSPLACARVALEDSAQNVVDRGRTGATGAFVLQAPRPGTYRVRVEARGWAPVYGPFELAKADDEKQREYFVRFTEQLLMMRGMEATDIQHARPTAIATEPIGARQGGKQASAGVASSSAIQSVSIGGSEMTPVLGIIGRVSPMTTWLQFTVDSTGRVDTPSILLPPDAPANAKAEVMSVLPRVRFSPAREAGAPTCELLRMQVNFATR